MKTLYRYWDWLALLLALAAAGGSGGGLRVGFVGLACWAAGWILGTRIWPPTVAVARQLRHRQANDLQALAGWLELGRPERALTVLETRMGETRCQAEWWRRVSPLLLPAWVGLETAFAARGIRLSYAEGPPAALSRLDSLALVLAARRALALEADEVRLYWQEGPRLEVRGVRRFPRCPWGRPGRWRRQGADAVWERRGVGG